MKTPWTGKTGLAKAATLLATVLLISLGLCGANWASIFVFSKMRPAFQNRGASALIVTGLLEIVGIVVSVVGLIVVGVLAVIMGAGNKKPKVGE